MKKEKKDIMINNDKKRKTMNEVMYIVEGKDIWDISMNVKYMEVETRLEAIEIAKVIIGISDIGTVVITRTTKDKSCQ